LPLSGRQIGWRFGFAVIDGRYNMSGGDDGPLSVKQQSSRSCAAMPVAWYLRRVTNR
jgi:hypothetical protein